MPGVYSRVLTSLSAISLLLCIAVSLLEIRGFWHPMMVPFMRHGEACRLSIERGAIIVDNEPQYLTDLANHHRDVAAMESIRGEDLMAPPPWHVAPRWGRSSVMLIPMLILGLFVGAAAPQLVRIRVRRSRQAKSMCSACGYNLTGNTSGVCPECGKRVRSPIAVF
jgi:hypothetical protein